MAIEPDSRSKWDSVDVRRVAHRVADMIADYLEQLEGRPVFAPVPVDEAARFSTEPLPTIPADPDAILDDFAHSIAPYPFGNGHPRFWGWVNSPPAVMGIFADQLAAAMNPSVAGGNHAAVHVERQVIRWFAEMLGLPSTSMGILVSGGSMANLTALAAARHAKAGFDVRVRGLQSGDQRLVVYMSEEGHGCIRKAVEMLGIGADWLRVIPVNERSEMRVDVLARTIDRDLQDGYRPIAVAASAGTVNTGAIDDLAAVARVCRDRGVWFHVDGAYGAAAVLSSRYRERLASLALADSVALDPHKWLYVPVEAGLVLVRDGAELRSAFSLVPPYLRTDGDPRGVGGPPWLSEFGFQQSRGFRALKVWMTLKYYGTSGYARAIDHDLALASYLADRVNTDAELELMAPSSLSVVCFRVRPAGVSGDERVNELNKTVLERLQLSGRAFLSSTVLNGRFVLRACVVNPLSAQRDVDAMLEAVKAFAHEAIHRLPSR
jgi:glutamate/tyrosine decarboxylase-like PLP-dependent enzyme